jgi:hypothetical protein
MVIPLYTDPITIGTLQIRNVILPDLENIQKNLVIELIYNNAQELKILQKNVLKQTNPDFQLSVLRDWWQKVRMFR